MALRKSPEERARIAADRAANIAALLAADEAERAARPGNTVAAPEITRTEAVEEPVRDVSSAFGEPASPDGRRYTAPAPKVALFAARGKARELTVEVDRLRAEHERLGILSHVELERRREDLRAECDALTGRLKTERDAAVASLEAETAAARAEIADLTAERVTLRRQVTVTEETALLQEVGVYEYRHPLTDAVAYQAELQRLRGQIKLMTRKDGGAVQGTTNWTVNGSAPQGRAMVRDFSKLMLRAYNAEADNLVRGLDRTPFFGPLTARVEWS
jgi:cell division protein FtsB